MDCSIGNYSDEPDLVKRKQSRHLSGMAQPNAATQLQLRLSEGLRTPGGGGVDCRYDTLAQALHRNARKDRNESRDLWTGFGARMEMYGSLRPESSRQDRQERKDGRAFEKSLAVLALCLPVRSARRQASFARELQGMAQEHPGAEVLDAQLEAVRPFQLFRSG